jgi:hypothetical protein
MQAAEAAKPRSQEDMSQAAAVIVREAIED